MRRSDSRCFVAAWKRTVSHRFLPASDSCGKSIAQQDLLLHFILCWRGCIWTHVSWDGSCLRGPRGGAPSHINVCCESHFRIHLRSRSESHSMGQSKRKSKPVTDRGCLSIKKPKNGIASYISARLEETSLSCTFLQSDHLQDVRAFVYESLHKQVRVNTHTRTCTCICTCISSMCTIHMLYIPI